MGLKPMATSETALCWFAVDYAEEEGRDEQLAVKFKTADTKNDFKAVFEAAQEAIKNKKDSPKKEEPASSIKPEESKNESKKNHQAKIKELISQKIKVYFHLRH